MDRKTIHLDELNPHIIVRTVLKNIWVLALLCASVLACYTGYARLTYAPVYTASATLMVSARDSTSAYNSLTTTQSMASVFVEVFQSNVLREKVREQMPEQTFSGSIGTTTIPETNLLIITVTSPAPDMAFRGLNLMLSNYESISEYLFANAQLEVIKDPVVPTVPANPQNISGNYPLLIAITALLGTALVVVLQILRGTVQTPAAARRNINARVLRTIGHEEKNKTFRSKFMRKNTAPLIFNPLISKRFIEDNLSLCSTIEYHMRKHKQKVILVTSVGENGGKSTVVANLALSLAEKNKKVLLLECDFRKPSMYKIFEKPVDKENTFSAYLLVETENPESFLLPLPKQGITVGISHASHKHISQLLHGGKLKQFLQQARTQYDYIVIDSPPMLAAADAEVLGRLADTTLVVVRTDFMPVTVINEWLDKLRKNAQEVCGIVLNDYQKTLL